MGIIVSGAGRGESDFSNLARLDKTGKCRGIRESATHRNFRGNQRSADAGFSRDRPLASRTCAGSGVRDHHVVCIFRIRADVRWRRLRSRRGARRCASATEPIRPAFGPLSSSRAPGRFGPVMHCKRKRGPRYADRVCDLCSEIYFSGAADIIFFISSSLRFTHL